MLTRAPGLDLAAGEIRASVRAGRMTRVEAGRQDGRIERAAAIQITGASHVDVRAVL
jgi:hypothetical protein